jgi:hypothetical protein
MTKNLSLGIFSRMDPLHTQQVCNFMAFSSCSPDLAPLVFAIFGYLKDQMYKGQFNESEELQEENVHCCCKIDYKMFQEVK